MSCSRKMPQSFAEATNEEKANKLRLERLLQETAEPLRRLFERQWKQATKQLWTNDTPAGAIFQRRYPRCYRAMPFDDMRCTVDAGDLKKWDVSLLVFALCGMNWNTHKPTLGPLRDARNAIDHRHSLTDTEFQSLWFDVEVIATSELSMPSARLDLLKTEPIDPREAAAAEAARRTAESALQRDKEAHRLAQIARDYEREELLENTATAYSEALAAGCSDAQFVAGLYADLSRVKLKLGDPESSARYGRMAHTVAPQWACGYVCHANALAKLGRSSEALSEYEIAATLDSTSVHAPDVKQRMEECREDHGRQERRERQNLNYRAGGRASELRREALLRDGFEFFDAKRLQAKQNLVSDDDAVRACALVTLAHLSDIKQDYEDAAMGFLRAAELGNPEGMYNYGLALEEGRGCTRDVLMAREYIARAANTPRTEFLDRCSRTGVAQGIAEAKHAMALEYASSGDLARALAGYREAADLFCGGSLNNLSVYYAHGDCVKRDTRRAIELARAAVFFDGSRSEAACSVSGYYKCLVHDSDDADRLVWALRWLELARRSGSTHITDAEVFALRQHIEAKKCHDKNVQRAPASVKTFIERLSAHTERRNDLMLDAQSATATHRTPWSFTAVEVLQNVSSSAYARQLGRAMDLFVRAAVAHRNGNRVRALALLAAGARVPSSELAAFVLSLDLVDDLAPNSLDDDPSYDSATVFAFRAVLTTHDKREPLYAVLLECTRRYSHDAHFHLTYGAHLCFGKNPDFESAIHHLATALTLLPHDLATETAVMQRIDVLYHLATAERLGNHCDDAKKHFAEYLSLIAHHGVDHRKMPNAWYALALLCVSVDRDQRRSDIPLLRRYRQLGIDTEHQLGWLAKEESKTLRKQVDLVLNAFGLSTPQLPPPPPATTSRVSRPIGPPPADYRVEELRRLLVRRVRERTSSTATEREFQVAVTTPAPGDASTPAARPSGSTEAFFEELLCERKDHVYVDRHMANCRIVLTPVVLNAHSTIAVDTRGTPFPLHIYNAPSELTARLTVGQRLTIFAPYFRLATDGTTGIRVTNPRLMELAPSGGPAVCWVCLRDTVTLFECSKCKRALYCSKDCQKRDFHDLLHKRECRVQC